MTMRRTTCPQCRKRLADGERIHKECVSAWADTRAAKAERAQAKVIKAAAKEERELTKKRKDALKPRAKWLAECQAIINKYVRLKAERAGEGCYTCGASPDQKFGGVFDASHFRSVGSAPHLRYWIPQIRICCVVCNRHKGGELLAFRRKLVAEHGASWVEALEARHEVSKFSIDYLARLKKVMAEKVRRLEKRMA